MKIHSALYVLRKSVGDIPFFEKDQSISVDRIVNDEYLDLVGDALVNVAGVAPKERRDILDMSEESYDYVMDINLKGAFF